MKTSIVATATIALSVMLAACSSSSMPTSPSPPSPSSATLADLSLNATTVLPGRTVQGTLTLAEAAPASGVTASVSSSNAAVATVPATVTIPAGARSATFTASAVAAGSATISAVVGANGARSATLNVSLTTALASLTLDSASVVGGDPLSGTVVLTGPAPAGGAIVSFASADPILAPATMTVPAGQTQGHFSVVTREVGGDITGRITATYGGTSVSAALTVTVPPTPRATFGVRGPHETETCELTNNGQTLDCTFDGTESSGPNPIVAWEWTYGVAKMFTQTTSTPVLSAPAIDCSIVPPPPMPSGQSWFTMTVSLRVRDSAGNVSDVSSHTGSRLLPQGFCGY
ncbi:MAG: hypothetical protein U0Q11_12515 [Vicinamibacterales bacterium]